MAGGNLILVLVDQMRRDAMSCAGDPNVDTPHLDALAARGTRFTQASSSYPACVPFRFSLLTGQHAHSRNVPALGYRLSPAERTLGEAVAGCGHATAWIGKWHLYSAYGVSGGLTLSQAARTPVPAGHRRGFDHWRGFELRNDFHDSWVFHDGEAEPRRLAGHQTDALFGLAFDYIRRDRPRDRPFFLVLSLEAPHPPFMATPGHLARIRARGPLRLRPNVDPGAIRFFPPEWFEPAGGPEGPVDPADPAGVARVFAANMEAWYAMIAQIDDGMGALDALLAAEGLREATTVVFLSDHGELGGSHGLLGKGQPQEESVGIPLIAAGPGIVPGRTIDLPVATEDLFPTLVGLAGGRAEGLPGLDLAGLLRGGPEPDREGVLLEYVAETRPGRGFYAETWRAIRTRRHKYAVKGNRAGARPWLLYDLAADPFEQHNLLDGPGHEATAAALHGALVRTLDAAEDDFALAPAFGHPARRAVPP
ncbi:MAG: sulfatase-like hydrolase/transferase [Rhodobacteraceae bacterium]|nr:sulfatase-like hydrolase/transferase [Paracoccaceae bacterium]